MEVNGVSPLDALYAEVHRQADERVSEIVPLLMSKGIRIKVNEINHKVHRPGPLSRYNTDYTRTRQELVNLREEERRARAIRRRITWDYIPKSSVLRSIQNEIAEVRVRLRALVAE